MRRLRRLLTILVLSAAALAVSAPFALYELGLSGIDALPQKPARLVSAEQQARIWKRARGEGVPHVDPMNPYAFALGFLAGPDAPTPPGQLVLWWAASDHLLTHRRHHGMGWWHLSGAALGIWLSRHWTSEEILSAACRARAAACLPEA